MTELHDTQPNSPFDTQPQKPVGRKPQPTEKEGPGCLVWGLVSTAALAFSLMVVLISGVTGYWSGQNAVIELAAGTQQAFVQEQITTWIPREIEQGNVALLQIRLEGLASLTPAPTELAALLSTATQFALEQQPTITPTPTTTSTPTATASAATSTSTPQPTDTTQPESSSADEPLFDVEALFVEAQEQMEAGEYDEATKTLDAIIGLDKNYRPEIINDMILSAFLQQATILLRSGDTADLSAGIIKANEAEQYGDIGDLNYERYIAGLYLNAASKEFTNPAGAIEGFSQLYSQVPNYLDVRQRLYNSRVLLGDSYIETGNFCEAVPQYQAALQILTGGDVETKLQTAQTSCSSGQAPANTTTEAGEGVATSTPSGPAPLGQRDN